MKKFLKHMLLSLTGPVCVLAIWIILANVIDNKLILPHFSAVLNNFTHPMQNFVGLGSLPKNVVISLVRVFLGYSVAVLIAVPLGVLMGYSKVANEFINSIVSLFRPVPTLSWAPLVTAWFGMTSLATIIGLTRGTAYVYLNNFKISMVFIIFLGGFFPTITSASHSVASVPKQLIESARVLGASERQVFFQILLPAAAPSILNGMRTGLGVAWTCLVSAEMLPGSISGVGYLIMHSYELARVDVVMTGIISIGVIGALLDRIFRLVENRKFRWKDKIK